MGFGTYKRSNQFRKNYLYQGVEIALKCSQDWGYHFEMEKIVQENSQIKHVETELHVIAKELGLKPMSEEQIVDFVQNPRKKQNLR